MQTGIRRTQQTELRVEWRLIKKNIINTNKYARQVRILYNHFAKNNKHINCGIAYCSVYRLTSFIILSHRMASE